MGYVFNGQQILRTYKEENDIVFSPGNFLKVSEGMFAFFPEDVHMPE
jgi:beta-galactosidase beta subunit